MLARPATTGHCARVGLAVRGRGAPCGIDQLHLLAIGPDLDGIGGCEPCLCSRQHQLERLGPAQANQAGTQHTQEDIPSKAYEQGPVPRELEHFRFVGEEPLFEPNLNGLASESSKAG